MKNFVSLFIISLMVAVACAQVFNQGLTAACQEPAGIPDSFEQGVCNCYSGYAPSTPAGTDCNAHSRCPPMLSDSNSATAGNQPRRPTTSFNNDQLTIVQKVAIVSNRKSSRIKFVQPLINGMPGNTPGLAGADTCSYPGILWTKTVDNLDCQDVFTATLPWTQASFCGFVQDTNSSTPQKTVMRTTLVHSYDETYNANGKLMTRTLSTSYLISVSFVIQKTVTSDNIAVVIADPTVTGFIKVMVVGDAVYDVASGNTILQFRTTAGWPYMLDSAGAVFNGSTPAITGIDATTVHITQIDDGADTCTNAQDSDCSQTWTVSIGAPSAVCNIQGVYAFQDSLDCRDTTTTSPCAKAAPAPVKFGITIGKTDLCAAEAIDTTAQNSYTLTPFYAPSDSSPTFSYQTGDMIYWQLAVVDPLATLDSVTFNNIMLYVTNEQGTLQSDVLFDNGQNATAGTNAQLAVTDSNSPVAPGSPAFLTFQYKLDRSVLKNTIAQLTSSSLVVEVTTSVTINLLYHGNQKRSAHFTERSSTATESRTVQLLIAPVDKAAPVAAAPPTEQGNDQANSLFDFANSASSLRSFIGLFVAIFVAVVLKF